jgi:hypothetical protein
MKNLLLPLIILFALTACSEKNDPENLISGDWELVSSVNAWTGEKLEGADLYYRQTYLFRRDGKFTKTQQNEDGSFQASGTYSIEQSESTSGSDIKFYLNLSFTDGDQIAGSCYGNEKEIMVYNVNKQLRNTWGECDGPIHTYDRK